MKRIKIIYACLLSLVCSLSYGQVNDHLSVDKTEMASEKQNGFDKISWKTEHTTQEIGKPELPVYRVSYVLPVDAVVTGVTFKKKNKQKLDGSFYLYPAQEQIYTDNSKDVKFTVPDSKVYELNQPYPNKMYEIESDRFLQGYHIVTLLIYPFEYIPKSRTLNYYTELDYTIQYTLGGNVDEIRPLTQTILRAEQCKDFVKSLVQNTEDVDIFGSNALSIRDGKKTIQKSSGTQKAKALSVIDEIVPEYIIITCDSLKSTFQTLADWKSKKGIFTIIKTTEEIASAYSGIDLAEKVRKYIIDAYSKWGAGLYILLGGDTNIVPARMVLGDYGILRPADRYYASYKGTWNNNGDNVYLGTGDAMTTDIGVILGRAPVENKKEAVVFNKKVISYEKADSIPSAHLNYFNNYLFLDEYLAPMCSNSHKTIKTIGNNLPNIYPKYIFDNSDWSRTDCYSGTTNSTTGDLELNKSNFLSCLNTGANLIGSNEKFHFIYAMHHSSPFNMGTSSIDKQESLTRYDMSQLTNGNYYQIFMSSGCEPVDFSQDCIAERYLNNPKGGGVAFIGNSDQGHGGDSYQCEDFFVALYNNGLYHIGSAFQSMLFKADYYAYNVDRDLANKRLHLLGDPEMQVWTNTPQALSVSVSQPSILLGNQTDTITLSNLPLNVKAMICIQKGTEVFTTQKVTGTGSTLKIPVNFTVDTPGTVNVTVTAHNFLPNEKTITANQTPAPNLYISTVDFGDGIVQGSGIGNGDGKNDAGETISLGLGIKNTGVNQANGVSAMLSCSSSYIHILNNQATLGSLASGVTTTGVFSYKIDSLAPERSTNDTIPVWFSLAINDVNNVVWKDTFNIDIFNTQIKQGNKPIVYTSNSNLTIEANDTVRFNIELKNIGKSQTSGIKATLIPNSTYIKTGSCSATPRLYPVIGYNEVKLNTIPFEFVASSSYSGGTINLKLKVENDFGKIWNFDFNLDKPSKVAGLDVASADSTEIELKWNYLSTNWGYNVYRCNVDMATGNPVGSYVKVNTDSINYDYFVDKNLNKLTKYLYKVSAISKSGNEGLLSDPLSASTSLSNTKSPLSLEFGAILGGITAVDINNDGNKEIFGAEKYGYVLGVDNTGKELYNIDGNVTTQGAFVKLQSEVFATPAIGDLFNDGQLYMVEASRNGSPNKLFCFKINASSAPTLFWSKEIPNGNYRGSILSNIDNSSDGSLEVVTLCENRQIVIHDANGNLLTTIGTPGGFYAGAIAVADLDGNGYKEIIMANGTGIYIWNYDGSSYKGINGAFYTNPSGATFNNYVLVCDIDNKATKEIIATTSNKVYAIRTDTVGNTLVANWNQPTSVNGDGFMSVGDLNHDGKIEVVTLGSNTVTVFDNQGNILKSETIANLVPTGNPILADVDDESDIEIIFGSTSGVNLNIFGYKLIKDGTSYHLEKALGFPLKTNAAANSTPTISDINNDGKNEIALGVDLWMYLWKSNGKANNIEWGSFFHDQYNTAEYTRNCNSTSIESNETWTSNHDFCGDLIVKTGTLTISNSNLTMGSSTTITVMSGASLIIDDANVLNANIRALSGSSVTIKNNGSIKLRSNAEFYTETGTVVDIPYGSVEN